MRRLKSIVYGSRWAATVAWLIGLTALVGWAFLPTLEAAAERWSNDPQYSHGYLVPFFSAALLYLRRHACDPATFAPSLFGFVLLAAGVAMRWVGVHYHYNGIDPLALVPTMAGAFVIVGGWPALRWAWPSVGFLVFMVPLPFRLQTVLSGQLQRLATDMSTYILQTLGLPAVAEGNVILIDQVRIGVVAACSGLGMIVTCAAISAGVSLLIRAPLWVKAALLLGAIPVSIATNVVRITAMGVLSHADHRETAQAVYHDLAGWLMMPIAVLLIGVELFILRRLVVRPELGPEDLDPLPLTGLPA